ncbi:MAG: hypothetical protein Q4D89_15580, partial [Arachnia propionica]|nr:hypothetical protein [Arachnia propionica]
PDLVGEWVSVGALQGLMAHGWQRRVGDGGCIVALYRPVGDGVVELGIDCDDWVMGLRPPREPARRTGVALSGDPARMDPVVLSETLRDLARLPWREGV